MGRHKEGVAEGKHLIKRYPNRKLYSVNRSTYVTLDDIERIVIDQDEQVEVIDSKTGEDLTGLTLLNIVFERDKRYAHRNAKSYEALIVGYKHIGELI